ncbi:MAG: hypothetical protein ACPG3X_03765 [Opitutales bacterium]
MTSLIHCPPNQGKSLHRGPLQLQAYLPLGHTAGTRLTAAVAAVLQDTPSVVAPSSYAGHSPSSLVELRRTL